MRGAAKSADKFFFIGDSIVAVAAATAEIRTIFSPSPYPTTHPPNPLGKNTNRISPPIWESSFAIRNISIYESFRVLLFHQPFYVSTTYISIQRLQVYPWWAGVGGMKVLYKKFPPVSQKLKVFSVRAIPSSSANYIDLRGALYSMCVMNELFSTRTRFSLSAFTRVYETTEFEWDKKVIIVKWRL